jgi:hypothetical protein
MLLEERMGVVEREDGCCWKRRWVLLNEKRRSLCLVEDDIKREKAVNELVDGFTLRTEWWSVLSGKIRQRHPTQQPRPPAR